MLEFICGHCGCIGERPAGQVNRRAASGNPCYCSRQCGFAARSARKAEFRGWHERRFEFRSTAVATSCEECGKAMWLPASKVAEYKRCGTDCNERWRKREHQKLVRPCETCGVDFRPRPLQVARGGGRFCSQKCNPSEHLITPEALTIAQQRRRENQAAGLIDWKTGPDHHSWKGGKDVAIRRRVESGKAAQSLRAYRTKNKQKVREWKQRRGKGKVLPRLPYGTIPRLETLQRWKCAICRTSVRRGYHLDHIMPIAKGGKHVPRNLQLLCGPCNVRKSAKDPITYMQQIGRLL